MLLLGETAEFVLFFDELLVLELDPLPLEAVLAAEGTVGLVEHPQMVLEALHLPLDHLVVLVEPPRLGNCPVYLSLEPLDLLVLVGLVVNVRSGLLESPGLVLQFLDLAGEREVGPLALLEALQFSLEFWEALLVEGHVLVDSGLLGLHVLWLI